MRRIFTYSFASITLFAALQAKAQNPPSTCSTPNQNVCTVQGGAIVNNFNTQAQANGWMSEATNGGFLNYNSTAGNFNNTTAPVVNTTGTYTATITSPSYNKGANFPNQIQAGFVMNKGANVIVDSIVLRIIETSSLAIEATCTYTGPFSNGNQQLCFGIVDQDITPGMMFNYQFVIYYRITGTTQNTISIDDFGYAALSNSPLPVRFTGLHGTLRSDNRVELTWTVDTEDNVAGYEVERSSDGVRFSRIGYVPAAAQRSYSYIDAAPLATGFYRIKSVDNDGKFGYSIIIRVSGNDASVVIKAYMSSATTMLVDHDGALKGSRITVSGSDGRLIRSVVPQVGAQQTRVDMSGAGTGVYIVRYETPAGQAAVIKLIKQ